jgi:hypothetical protein
VPPPGGSQNNRKPKGLIGDVGYCRLPDHVRWQHEKTLYQTKIALQQRTLTDHQANQSIYTFSIA